MSEVFEVIGLAHLSDEEKETIETAVIEAYERGYKHGHRRGLVENLLNTEFENEDD